MQARTHAESRKRVDIYNSASVACARAMGAGQTVCDPERQAGTRQSVDIYKSAIVACALATRTQQTVCDPRRDARKV